MPRDFRLYLDDMLDAIQDDSSGRSARLSASTELGEVSRRSLEHLGLPTRAPSLRAPPDQTNGLAGDHPREWSYEPFLDDLPIPDPATA